MIRVVDIEGNWYPIPSHKVMIGNDIYLQLSERYFIKNIDLFFKHSHVRHDSVLDPEVLSGATPIAAIPSHCMPQILPSSETCSVDRFSHFAFGPAPLPETMLEYDLAFETPVAPIEQLPRAEPDVWLGELGLLIAMQRAFQFPVFLHRMRTTM
jgi:hypothetical protein